MDAVEQERLARLREYGVLDTPPEPAFDRITALAADLFDAPIAAVSLIDADRQWFKSALGLTLRETPRAHALGDHAIRSAEVTVIPDARQDPRFAGDPLVIGSPSVRFYAGAPLAAAGGQRLGTLCVMDRSPRPELTVNEKQRLAALAAVVVDEMDLSLARSRLALALEKADAAEQAKSEFLANITHELRTPLTSILGYAGILAAGALDEREKRFAERIQGSGNTLLSLITDLLDLARLEAGKIELSAEPADVRDIASAALRVVNEQARAKGLGLTLKAPEALPPLQVATAALRQAMVNLLANAVKFTEAGSVSLTISLPRPGRLALEIADTGVGIPADRLDHIFERFVQADASIARRFGGTGIGLAISKRLVEQMGGELSVASELGRGSVFRIELPTG